MEKIIDPISREILKKELNKDRFLRYTRKGDNEIYCVDFHNSPNVVREIGRLREVSFRGGGGGTGLSIDLDDFDTSPNCYKQLIVWSPEDEAIVGDLFYAKMLLIKKEISNFLQLIILISQIVLLIVFYQTQ